ncbi:conserved hypothetical protein [Leishmania braziliensis MHOM/BR/75/M2904]|uniref:Uncharacterized protein n=1 Tax=Leishmania braziliensis TaxID=5660 RepID=A4HIX9_LEIBR|nr:conserved hypothetical protein [Leishmania braziliensis MHOM/BR/75/M2904]CAJ2477648.1 unnamed protein product [Leishmania braziliensis]CAM42435.1 conserved hypothetical protein [Leishmania braziliensis MHOM/BR/75/M2904]
MKSRDGAIDKGLARHLYRRVLRLVSVAEQPHTQRIAQVQWAEFMPSQVWIAPDDELRRIVRRSFEAPHTPSTLTNAFAFLKEARSSLFSIWVLAEWERLEEKQDPWDVYDGMALMSAALHGACVGCDSQQSFERCIKDYQMGIRSCVQNIAQSVQERMDVRSLEAGRAKDLNTFVRLVREASTLERREAKPADFSFVSLLQSHCASEYVLNIVLVFVLRALDIHSTLVGANLSFRWVRVMPRKNTPPIFASWTYGAMRRREVEQLIRTADTQWYRSVPWDASQRKGVVCALLQRQLGCLPGHLDTRSESIMSTCKKQILFLLS